MAWRTSTHGEDDPISMMDFKEASPSTGTQRHTLCRTTVAPVLNWRSLLDFVEVTSRSSLGNAELLRLQPATTQDPCRPGRQEVPSKQANQ